MWWNVASTECMIPAESDRHTRHTPKQQRKTRWLDVYWDERTPAGASIELHMKTHSPKNFVLQSRKKKRKERKKLKKIKKKKEGSTTSAVHK